MGTVSTQAMGAGLLRPRDVDKNGASQPRAVSINASKQAITLELRSGDGTAFVPWSETTPNITMIAGAKTYTEVGLPTMSDCTFYGELTNLAG